MKILECDTCKSSLETKDALEVLIHKYLLEELSF